MGWLLTSQPDKDIPIDEESGLENWDCAESLDLVRFAQTIQYIREHDGDFPPDLDSKEDHNELGPSGVPDDIVTMMHEEITKGNLLKKDDEDIILCFVDGFLLYLDPNVVHELDIRLLLRASYQTLKARREARTGYVTLEGTLSIWLVGNG
jgi:nicotinamide/nicotinate riboside kinase